MPRVIIQPAGQSSQKNFKATIEKQVPLATIRPHVNDDKFNQLTQIYGEDGSAPTWGVRPYGEDDWLLFQPGDIVAFMGFNHIYRTMRITTTLQRESLSLDLWGRHPSGDTWEFIFFLEDTQVQDIPTETYNELMGHSLNYRPVPMELLTQYQSDLLIPLFDLDDDLEEYTELIDAQVAQGDPDGQSLRNSRREQTLLRKMLLDKRRQAPCSICGDDLPEDLLVAAHIKPRAKCTRDEKLDLRNIAMLMCKMGCDDLYEHGYMAVVDGMARTSRLAGDPPRLALTLSNLEGRQCSAWNERSRKYFLWHQQNVHRGN